MVRKRPTRDHVEEPAPVPEPAASLEEMWSIFDPTLAVDPASNPDPQLLKLCFELKRTPHHMHAFLCGHRGSGKTTELKRLRALPEITEKYLTVYLTAQDFGSEAVHLTHDALLVEIGLALVSVGEQYGLDSTLADELDKWGQQVVRTFLHNEEARAEAGAGAHAWIAFFKAQLSTRREWKTEQKQILEPKVQDLVDILNRMAQDLKNRSQKRLLVIVDDLEKGESDAHREMHGRLFQEHYEVLVQPRFSIVYTLPIYFRALPGSRVPSDHIYAFSAARIYERVQKSRDRPPLSREGHGYQLMYRFVETRVRELAALFAPKTLDELVIIGGGLFRETARAIRDAAYFALIRNAVCIEQTDVRQVFDQIKKEYQPIVRGEAVRVLKAVLDSEQGWVPDVEPYLQSRAVVEYEDDDLWLDLRYVLKSYVRGLALAEG